MKRFMSPFLLVYLLSFLLFTEFCATSEKMTYEPKGPLPTAERTTQEVRHVQVQTAVAESNLPGEDDSYEMRTGFQAGVIMPVAQINEFLNFRAELNGSLQGANYSEDYGLKGTVSLFYLNLPLVMRYQFRNGFFGEAGIQPGFCISAKDKYSGETHNFKEYINTFDFGIPLGIGYEFKNNFGLGLRVIEGVTNIYSGGDAKNHNFVLALRGTYAIRLKK
jgi:hypothetical protein